MNCEPEKIKIIYNPYAQKAAYKRWSNGAWIDLGSNSQLNSEQYQNNITLQNRGIDIVRQILEDYDDGTIGVNLVFEGTDNDFEDLQNILTLYFTESEYKIDCTRSDKRLISADDAAQEIKSIFAKMEQTFEENPSEELQAEIDRYKKTVKSTVTVCILGTYSAGKSAFINALIGEEILPSASDPSTATIYRVHTAQESKIRFKYKAQEVELYFSGTAYKPNVTNLAGDKLLSMIKANIENGDIHNCNAHMYYALEAINNFAKDTQQSSGDANDYPTIIDVYVPFRDSILPLNKHDFVFIDTPGADSETFKKHLEVTRDALKDQTCGLPIIITEPDGMDKAGNAEVNTLLENNGGALDISNTIVVVNKSDIKSNKTLNDKKSNIDDLFIARLHSNRVFFVSSAMGVAGKKVDAEDDETWIDDDLYTVYDGAQKRFENPESKNYMRLYLYNIIPDNRWEELCRRAEAAPESERMLYNSGIRSVEDEIGLFAKKYAGYNKCTQARKYLERALEITQKSIEKSQRESDSLSKQLNQSIDEKTNALCKELKASCEKLKEDIPQQTAEYLRKKAPITQVVNGLTNQLSGIWENIKQDKTIKGGKAKKEKLMQIVSRKYSNEVKNFLNLMQSVIEDNARMTSETVKDVLCKVVNESSFVNPSDRDKLAHVILRYPHVTVPATVELSEKVTIRYEFLWFHWENPEKISKNNMHEFVDKQFRQCCAEYTGVYTERYQKSLTRWIDALCFEIVSNISDFSPALRSLNSRLQAAMRQQQQLSKQQKDLQCSSERIENLLETEEVY